MKLIAIVNESVSNQAIFGHLARQATPELKTELFASPEEAMAHFIAGHHPDLVVTDFQMSGMGGAAFISALREQSWGHDMPVVVVAAHEDRDWRLAALRAGATDFLVSPVDHGEFVTRMRNLLHLAASRRQMSRRAMTLERELAESHRARAAQLQRSRQHLLQVIDTVPAMISATDGAGRYVFVNRCMAESMYSTPEALIGTLAPGRRGPVRCESMVCKPEQERIGCCGEKRDCCGERFEEIVHDSRGRERVHLTSDTPLKMGESETPLWLKTSLDITDLKVAQRKLHVLAYQDQLTGAPNRLKVEKTIQALVSGAKNEKTAFALFLLDLDRFKAINDTLGHSKGDRVLKSVVCRLAKILPDAVVSGRFGGDEFGIVLRLNEADCEQEACVRAAVILDAFVTPFAFGEEEGDQIGVSADDSVVITTVSIGVAVHHGGPVMFDTLLRRADMAMYKAKAAGGNTYELFRPEMEAREEAAMRIELDLHRAVPNRELELHYQPQLDLRSGRIVGVEALLRWRRADGNLLAPGIFLPVAEETGLIVPITEWVLKEACRQLSVWRAMGISVRMAVNMSGVLFRRSDIRGMVLDVIERSGINPSDLELELTESVLIRNTDSANRQLADLRKLGAAVAVDDFGTGYASLTYLSRLVIDRIKIDKSFIDRIEESESDQAIVRSMITLCRNLGIRVTAEGIERPEQAQWLARQRCDEGQGFYFGRPQPADKIAVMIHATMHGMPRDDLTAFVASVSAEGSELAP
ncbi:EAL domain-containing protein [Acetobacter musti]|uniref:EAL domain-containing protein n=1 Tax=Acetobacter musti TaxID=864732 RepID=A0ABX0JM66_9PROT|nr:EAL domain-containing protein [Acetobacter musti]NHN84488.1 EAL domain-containing protein [Acetobacter musti]